VTASTRRFLPAALAAVALIVAGCGSSGSNPTAPTPTAPFSQTDLQVGTGATATSGRVITVNYTGWLYDPSATDQKGAQFDTSTGRGPFSFVLGVGAVIRGWDQGVPGMQVGGRRRLVVPPELAYGSSGSGPIPPNATLVFDIELLVVN
jgi:FKBP-type peptidyl-prolyl cis-trans isomerase FkpA